MPSELIYPTVEWLPFCSDCADALTVANNATNAIVSIARRVFSLFVAMAEAFCCYFLTIRRDRCEMV